MIGVFEVFLISMLVPGSLAMQLRGSHVSTMSLSTTANTTSSNEKNFPSTWNSALTVFKIAGQGTFGKVILASVDGAPGKNVAIKYSQTPDSQSAIVARNEASMIYSVTHKPYFMG